MQAQTTVCNCQHPAGFGISLAFFGFILLLNTEREHHRTDSSWSLFLYDWLGIEKIYFKISFASDLRESTDGN